jgi:uncharacterized membrane protein
LAIILGDKLCYALANMPRRKTATTKRPKIRRAPVTQPLRFLRQKTVIEKLADSLTSFFGTIIFLFLNLVFFTVWIVWNLKIYPATNAFDPYPFGMLTMIVSLEAIVLSIVVLISQNRANKIADAREEIDFEVDVASEQKVEQILSSLDIILKHLKLQADSKFITRQPVDLEKLERRVMAEIDTD